MYLELKKGDRVIYLGSMFYGLANGQEVNEQNEELVIESDVIVQKEFFKKVEVPKVEVKKEEVKPKQKNNKK